MGWGWEIDEEKIVPAGAFHDSFGHLHHELLHIVRGHIWYMAEGTRYDCPPTFGQTFLVAKRGKQTPYPWTNEDAPKMSVTDMISKGLSYLGFAAEIFTGEIDNPEAFQNNGDFSDNKYVNSPIPTVEAVASPIPTPGPIQVGEAATSDVGPIAVTSAAPTDEQIHAEQPFATEINVNTEVPEAEEVVEVVANPEGDPRPEFLKKDEKPLSEQARVDAPTEAPKAKRQPKDDAEAAEQKLWESVKSFCSGTVKDQRLNGLSLPILTYDDGARDKIAQSMTLFLKYCTEKDQLLIFWKANEEFVQKLKASGSPTYAKLADAFKTRRQAVAPN